MAWFQVSFFSECLSRSVPLNVLIPSDDFGPAVTAGQWNDFRTVYLLHGYAGSCADWLLNGQLNELSRQYNLAIVMPSGNNGFYVDQPNSGIRGSAFIGRELVEFTRKVFPLSDRREETVIAGSSMGGYGAIYNAFKFSETFGHAIALSAPIGLGRVLDPSGGPGEAGLNPGYFEALHGDLSVIRQTDRNLELLAGTLLKSNRCLPDLYIACGVNDIRIRENRLFADYLKSIGFPCFYEEGPGTHDWGFWNTYLRYGLSHVFPDSPTVLPNPFWVGSEAFGEGAV
jgi:S-formylglutathione hydrolase FrmB